MTATFTIQDPTLEKKYTSDELKIQFLSFLEQKDAWETLELYEVEYDNLPSEAQESYNSMDQTSFVKR